MSRLPALTGGDAIRALRHAESAEVRQRGSHVFLKHADGRATVVPVHAGETLGPGLLARFLRDVQLTREKLHRLLR